MKIEDVRARIARIEVLVEAKDFEAADSLIKQLLIDGIQSAIAHTVNISTLKEILKVTRIEYKK